MPLILNIDTSGEQASICLAKDEEILSVINNPQQKDHASWLQPAIREAMKRSGLLLENLDAIGITSGPGSYTGLRVGMATAKGLCYALALPLITVNTLEAMATTAFGEDVDYICPMIDAKRMEVFTAIYDKELSLVLPPVAMVLNETSFLEWLEDKRIIFFGSGHQKFQKIFNHHNAFFKNLYFDSSYLTGITSKKFSISAFSDLAYSVPDYLKEFYRTN